MVLVITGKDKGKKGKGRVTHTKARLILVEGVNFIKKHSRAKKQARQAGIIDLEAPVRVANVMLLCAKCNQPTRIGFTSLDDGKKVRICRTCQEVID